MNQFLFIIFLFFSIQAHAAEQFTQPYNGLLKDYVSADTKEGVSAASSGMSRLSMVR